MSLRDRLARQIIAWLTVERPSHSLLELLADHDALMREVRPGDVLLMEGMTRVGGMIKTISQSTWSHAALSVGKLDGGSESASSGSVKARLGVDFEGPVLLEVLLGQGAVLKPLADYRHTHVRLCRPRGITAHDQEAIVAYALARVGYGYDLRQLVDLARFALPWRFIPRRFRSSLFSRNAGPHTRTVCSTLIAEAFQSVGFPILPILVPTPNGMRWYHRNSRLSVPKDFDLSPFFDVVKVSPVGYRDYQALVWELADTPPQQDAASSDQKRSASGPYAG
ncbi:MAG: YiiX/YebB-like N1pC/P60 family cysteine hydrolase [Acidiferrobacter sp.]